MACVSVVQRKRSDSTSLAGVPAPDASSGGVVRPMLGDIVADAGSCRPLGVGEYVDAGVTL